MATSSNAMQTQQQQSKQPLIVQYLQRYQDQIAAALPKHLTADRMARIVTTEVRKVPQLLECNPKSLFGAVIQASQLGLEPGSALGHCYLIPFKKDVTLIIGYRGMIDLARRSGQIVSIEARAVYEADEFHYSFGLEPDLQHVPSPDDEKGALTHVYAVARLKDGGLQWDVMTRAEIEAIRQQSKAGNSGPWKTHFDEMAKKTVIRRLFKYLPVSVEIQQAVGLDEQADAGVAQRNDAVIEGDFMALDGEGEGVTERPTRGADAVREKLAGSEPGADQEQPGNPGEPAAEKTLPDADDVVLKFNEATSIDSLDELADLHLSQFKGAEKKKLQQAYQQRREELDAA